MLEFYDGSFNYTYGENRIVTATLIGGGTETYSYDAEGQRIRKTNGTATIEYVYDKDGHQLGEMQPSGVMIGSEVYAGSRHLATYNSVPYQTVFIHADWQGTERARTLYDGSGYQNCVNLPYGDGQICNTAPSDPSPLHYTGKMRDTETGLDYFGARYYSSAMGHWMSPDWADKPTAVPYANFGNPQSLNLYAMVAGNPVSKQDSDGHMFTLSEIEYGDGKNGPTTVFTGDGQDSSNLGGMRYILGYVNAVFPDGTRSSAQQSRRSRRHKSPYQAGNRAANVLYHETSSLRPKSGETDAGDLHDMRVDAAHVYNNVHRKSAFQDSNTLSSNAQAALRNGVPDALAAYNDSLDAVSEAAADRSDPTGGANHFFIRDMTLGDKQNVPSWTNGDETSFGPFTTSSSGDGGIRAGDTVYVWITKE